MMAQDNVAYQALCLLISLLVVDTIVLTNPLGEPYQQQSDPFFVVFTSGINSSTRGLCPLTTDRSTLIYTDSFVAKQVLSGAGDISQVITNILSAEGKEAIVLKHLSGKVANLNTFMG